MNQTKRGVLEQLVNEGEKRRIVAGQDQLMD